jgi:hypothetical protein
MEYIKLEELVKILNDVRSYYGTGSCAQDCTEFIMKKSFIQAKSKFKVWRVNE